jgi:hypothetical protein
MERAGHPSRTLYRGAEMDAETAVALLVDRFPEVLARVDAPQDAFTASPYLAYGLFAQEVVEKKEENDFLNRATTFMNELAESGDALLEEVLVVSVLERIAEDESLVHKLKGKLRAKAGSLMKKVEEEYFGRAT